MHLDDAGFIKGEPMAVGQFKQDGEYPVGRDSHGGNAGPVTSLFAYASSVAYVSR
jgi:hypothetical protein